MSTCALTLREVYGLPLRSTQGLISSVLRLLWTDLPAPRYSTLSRRAARLEVALPRLTRGPLHLAVDSTGIKLYGEGEWKVRLHGTERRRTWRKLHLVIDHRTQEAVSLSMTNKDVLDRREVRGLLQEVEGEVVEVLGDGAYDFQACYRAIHERGGALRHPAQAAGAGAGRGGVHRPRRGRRARARGREG